MVAPDDVDEITDRFKNAVQNQGGDLGEKWRTRATSEQSKEKFVSGLTDIDGISEVDDEVVSDFEENTAKISASEFEDSLSGNTVLENFKTNFVEGVTGNIQR